MCQTDYGGGGGKNVPKIYYVICEQPKKRSHFMKTTVEKRECHATPTVIGRGLRNFQEI